MRIRALLAEAERIVESRELLDARDLVSDDYLDERNHGKRQLLRLLGGYMLRNQSIHLLVQVHEIEIVDEQRARVRLYAALAARPFDDLEALFSMRAGLYRFDLELVLEKDAWRLRAADWKRATREDFLRS